MGTVKTTEVDYQLKLIIYAIKEISNASVHLTLALHEWKFSLPFIPAVVTTATDTLISPLKYNDS